MTKGLPDPPTRPTTAASTFGNCECSHPSLFTVRDGVDLEDALVHLSTLLKGAFATNLKAMELATGTCYDLLLANDHGLDTAKAVVEAVLDGLERRAT
ncbi:DUF3077 domain-containing protein [Pseudomonas entomophila]|nr:DUF3077 domain-containing protein [Pseudomonas entomophila]MDF0729655.1 DUF3077 domain-containing protein [Pseudomonas entomophila]